MFKKFFVAFLLMLFVSAVPVSATEAPEEAKGRYVSRETDTTLAEKLTSDEFQTEVAEDEETGVAKEMEMLSFDAGKKYYAQAKYKCNDGYDVIAAYILENGEYKSRVFFVWENIWSEWLRYDYSDMAAQEFLSDWEVKESNGATLYVPVAKKDADGNTVAHKDREGTALDESKVPVIRTEDIANVGYA